MLLSICILTIESRKEKFNRLKAELIRQCDDLRLKLNYHIEILVENAEGDSIGLKRNRLLKAAKGEHICFIDDDDLTTENYLSEIWKGFDYEPDCMSLRGIITWNGERPQKFEHSIKYSEYATTENEIKYERYPNHLNVIKSSIAKQFNFPLINHGEDTDWATQIKNSGLLKREYFIDKVIYNYLFIENK